MIHPSGRSLMTIPTPPLRSHGRGDYCLGSHNDLLHAVVAVKRVRNIRLYQNHQVLVTELHGPDGLGEAKATDVPYIVSSEVYPWGAWRPAPRWWRRSFESVVAIAERVDK